MYDEEFQLEIECEDWRERARSIIKEFEPWAGSAYEFRGGQLRLSTRGKELVVPVLGPLRHVRSHLVKCGFDYATERLDRMIATLEC